MVIMLGVWPAPGVNPGVIPAGVSPDIGSAGVKPVPIAARGVITLVGLVEEAEPKRPK